MTTEDEIRKEIKLELGMPIMTVEIDDSQWDAIFARSKRWFKAKKGVIACETKPISDDVFVYDFPTNACDVVDIVLPRRSDIQSLLSLGFFDIVPLNALNIGAVTSAFNSYSAYTQILQALETRRRVFSADPDWEVFCSSDGTKKIHLIGGTGLCAGGQFGNMLIFYSKKDWDVNELMGRDENLFFRYTLATAKYFLGRIRSKYKSYPAAGGSIETDGPELIAEANEDFERLDEEISDSQGPMGIIVA